MHDERAQRLDKLLRQTLNRRPTMDALAVNPGEPELISTHTPVDVQQIAPAAASTPACCAAGRVRLVPCRSRASQRKLTHVVKANLGLWQRPQLLRNSVIAAEIAQDAVSDTPVRNRSELLLDQAQYISRRIGLAQIEAHREDRSEPANRARQIDAFE